MKPLYALLVLASALWALPGDNCKALRHHGKLSEARDCFNGLLRSNDPFARAEGAWGVERFQEASDNFRAADKAYPKPAELKTEWGLLFLERFRPGDAAKLFTEALQADTNYAPAYLGMARIAAASYSRQAVEAAGEALKHDAKLYQAHELLAYLALEDDNPKQAAEVAGAALAISSEALDALAVLASIDWLNDKPQPEPLRQLLAINPRYGEAYITGGHFLVINRRYNEAIALFRKALELNPGLGAARSQLGINLMRQGDDVEARRQLEQAYNQHYSDEATRNSLKLLDRVSDFTNFSTAGTRLRIDNKEAALLQPYVAAELSKAMALYERKYGVKLPGPVSLQLYPNHEDFIVRTLGLPGQGGLLGVTFGLAVAMDSPTAREPGAFGWASTLWHEMSHVYVLSATNHRVPRWFTEGLAVHEESAASPDWGDRMTPDIVSALAKKQLLPVTQLDRGFIRPTYSSQVLVSYFQAGQICDFIAQKWGDSALNGMIRSYAALKSTGDTIQENLHESAAAFDKEFLAWLDKRTANTVTHLDEWKTGMKDLHARLKNMPPEEIARQATRLRDFYPEYVGGDSAYQMLADAYDRQKNRTAAITELERYRDTGGKDVEQLKKLAQWEQQSGNARQARNTLTKLIYIYPEDEEIHRRLSGLLLEAGDANGAVRESKALLALKPADAAESHFQLARALQAAHRSGEAKDEVVLALEAAPGYKPAQQLLLQLSQ